MNEPIQVRVDAALKDLVPGFLAGRRRDLEAIRCALGEGDLQAVDAAGRRLRGFARVYGFHALIAFGESLQAAVEARDVGAIGEVHDRLADYLERIQITDQPAED
jgi:HPt (histidine-containing phosphotransfer) domain-containing protein